MALNIFALEQSLMMHLIYVKLERNPDRTKVFSFLYNSYLLNMRSKSQRFIKKDDMHYYPSKKLF